MNFHQSVQNSVENIKDELRRISSLASSFSKDLSGTDPALQKLQKEYNRKLRKLNSLLQRAEQKNLELSERVTYLEAKLRSVDGHAGVYSTKARPSISEGDFRLDLKNAETSPIKRKRKSSLPDVNSDILSSPIKDQNSYLSRKNSPRKTTFERHESGVDNITSSQFNRLATQYSDVASQYETFPDAFQSALNDSNSIALAKRSEALSEGEKLIPLKATSSTKRIVFKPAEKINVIESEKFASDDESDINVSPGSKAFIADSQDEFEPLRQQGRSPAKLANIQSMNTFAKCKSKFPSHYTALQRIEFLRNYLQPKFADKNFSIDFSQNPITEKGWALEDFVPNENWKPPKKINSNLGVMTKAQEKTYHDFFTEAGLGRRSVGPVWDSDEASDHSIDGGDWVRSQVMNKYSSPPGYMVGDFASTQEMEVRKQMKDGKEQERIQRRLRSATSGGEFLFYEEIFNHFVSAGRFLNGP